MQTVNLVVRDRHLVDVAVLLGLVEEGLLPEVLCVVFRSIPKVPDSKTLPTGSSLSCVRIMIDRLHGPN